MNGSFEAKFLKYQKYTCQKELIEEVILLMREDEFTIIETIKGVRLLYNISLANAKNLVTTHPAWSDIVNAHTAFHEELAKIINQQNFQRD